MILNELRFEVSEKAGAVSALLLRPEAARRLLILAHGAGAGMRHPFLERTARVLAERGIATFRYQFPYTERGARRPDPRPVLLATVRSAIAAAAAACEGVPLLAGGKSMGGRMTSLALSESDDPRVQGVVFLGFPLSAPGRADAGRAEHLASVRAPMLFVQGDRDKLAPLPAIRPVCERLGARATLHVVEGGDHSFHVLKSSGRNDAQVLDEIGGIVAEWAATLDRPARERPARPSG
jgi:predicted alpha/beta-hydrolase family hydrolase